MLRIRPTSQQPCAKFVEINKCNTFDMIYKLLKLALLSSIASASVSNLNFSPTCIKYLDPPLDKCMIIWMESSLQIALRHLANVKR